MMQLVPLERFDWLVALDGPMVAWRSVETSNGAQYVTMDGRLLMPGWLAGNWDSQQSVSVTNHSLVSAQKLLRHYRLYRLRNRDWKPAYAQYWHSLLRIPT